MQGTSGKEDSATAPGTGNWRLLAEVGVVAGYLRPFSSLTEALLPFQPVYPAAPRAERAVRKNSSEFFHSCNCADLHSKIEQGSEEAATRRTWKYVEEAADEANAAI